MKKMYYLSLLSVVLLCLFAPSARRVSAADSERSVNTEAGVTLRKVDKIPEEPDKPTEPQKPQGKLPRGKKPLFPKTGEIIKSGIAFLGTLAIGLMLLLIFWKRRKEKEAS